MMITENRLIDKYNRALEILQMIAQWDNDCDKNLPIGLPVRLYHEVHNFVKMNKMEKRRKKP